VPCAGPVLAAITVAGATGHIGLRTVGLTLGFAVGTAIPLLAFALAGRGLTQRLGAFRRHQGAFRAVSGAVAIVLAVALTWNAYDNQSWPAAYLIDASGQIRHVSVGEGDYGGEEQLIRQLLTAAHPGMALPRATDVPDTTPEDSAQTPETYLGAERQQGYHGSAPYATGQFTAPATLPADSFALAGAWTIGQESITAGQGAGITLAFHASKVYLDIGGTGTVTVSAGGTSKVIRISGAPDIYTVATEQPAGDGTVTIRLSPGLQAYSFTFG
jgi:hypothetical protein